MEKSSVVLHLYDDGEDDVYFDGVGRMYSIFMPRPVFLDMGRPNKITVTIEPGDRLNTEES